MTLFFAFHTILVLAIVVRILLRDDLSPPARLAWFVVLILLPYFGTVIYLLFGEIAIGRSARRRHRKVSAEIRTKASAFMGAPGASETLIDPLYRPAFRYAASINGFHPVEGNAADLMADGDETLRRMVADIDAATAQVHLLSYIWLEDHTGTQIAEALMRAARRGVTCRAMADGMGSRAMVKSALWKRMGEAGVHCAIALSFRNLVRVFVTSRVDLRNHRKIMVIDGHITYCGSRNLADPEFLPKAKYAPWVDIMLRFTGPVAAQNQLLFASDWMQATGESLDGFDLLAQPVAGGFPAQVMGVGPTGRRGATPQLFANLIASADRDLTISTPYFVPDTTLTDALCAAAYRGVAVTLIFPKVNDSWIVAAVSHSYYHRLLDAGCVIHEFEGGLLHAKTMTIDGKVSVVGSSNLDLRSFDLNYENNILLQDEVVTSAIFERQQDYIRRSEQVLLPAVLAWPWYRRIWNNVIATVGPVL